MQAILGAVTAEGEVKTFILEREVQETFNYYYLTEKLALIQVQVLKELLVFIE